jgi:hypothetical protein
MQQSLPDERRCRKDTVALLDLHRRNRAQLAEDEIDAGFRTGIALQTGTESLGFRKTPRTTLNVFKSTSAAAPSNID